MNAVGSRGVHRLTSSIKDDLLDMVKFELVSEPPRPLGLLDEKDHTVLVLSFSVSPPGIRGRSSSSSSRSTNDLHPIDEPPGSSFSLSW